MIKLLIFFALIGSPSAAADELTPKIQSIECASEARRSTCRIAIVGEVKENDVLFMMAISDIDVTTSNGKHLGSTGYAFGKKFYAQFVPRIYPIYALAGEVNPEIVVEAESVLSDSVGVSSLSTIDVVKLPEALLRALAAIVLPLGASILALILTHLTWTSTRKKIHDNWDWNRVAPRIFAPCAGLFLLSMSRVLRVAIPSVISFKAYYILHGVIEACAIWAIGVLLATVNYPDPKAKDGDYNSRTKANRSMLWIAHISGVVAAITLVSQAQDSLKQAHSYAVAIQAAGLLFIASYKAATFPWQLQFARSMRGSLVLFAVLLASSAIFARDAVVYLFAHKPGTVYYIQWAFVVTGLALWYRAKEFLGCQVASLEMTRKFRETLGDEPDLRLMGSRICEAVQGVGTFARVTLLSVKGDEAFLVASAGPEALAPDPKARPLGPMLKLAVAQPPILHLTKRDLAGIHVGVAAFERSFVILSIARGGAIQSAVAIMSRSGETLKPGLVKVIELAATAIGLEVVAFVEAMVAEQTKNQLAAMARCTSGIVFETQDSWGRLSTDNKTTRRIIVSADGLKTTRISERTATSDLLGRGISDYKRELYAIWFALLEKFEFLSKDVRGDDFWAVSPGTFQDESLRAMGSARVGIYLAHLLEVHSRRISLKPEYQAIGFVGAHVALGSAEIRILVLGTKTRQCVDVDSPYMARLHRLRSSAGPGHVLADVGQPEVRDAVGLTLGSAPALFRVDANDVEDLLDRPEVVRIEGIEYPPTISRLEAEALKSAEEALAWGAARAVGD